MMRRLKKVCVIIISIILIINNMSVTAYPIENAGIKNIKAVEKKVLKDIVYLTDGQGNTIQGDGTINSPYQNIKTAMDNVSIGGTIKIVGTLNYTKYEETPSLLRRPLLIDKKVTFEGESELSVFSTRAPIQLGADVTFKNINMQFWASNELMPDVPDSGIQQNPIDEGTNFRSGRSIYLAGNKLTLDNVNTRIDVLTYQNTYRPYISGGTFLDEGEIGDKSILEVINPNENTEFAGIYAGDYWIERDLPVELNIQGEVLDKTIHSGGIMAPFKGDVVVNIYKKTGINTINTEMHNGALDINVTEETTLLNLNMNKVRKLILKQGAQISFNENSSFNVNNLTLQGNALLDLRSIKGNPEVNENFIGGNNENEAGSIYLDKGKVLNIGGDVEGYTVLNAFRNEKISLEEGTTYIRAKENATGNFIIRPKYYQSDYRLEKNISDNNCTTWTTVRDKVIFKDVKWKDGEDVILNPSYGQEYIFSYECIDENDQVYVPFGEDWDDIFITLTKPDGSALDLDNSFDGDFEIYNYGDETSIGITIYDTRFVGELTLKISHKDGTSISKKLYVGMEKPEISIIDLASVAKKYNLNSVDEGYEECYDFNKDKVIDIYDLVIIAKYIK